MTTNDNREALAPDTPEYVTIPGAPGDGDVACAVYPPLAQGAGGPSGMVIHLYGSSGSCRVFNMQRPPYMQVRRLLRERGYWLVVPDLGGAHWMNEPACRTIDAVIAAWIDNHGVDPARVHLLGTSMGGGSGLAYIARRPNRIRSMCAVFPMTDFARFTWDRPNYLAPILQAHHVSPDAAACLLDALSPIRHPDAYAGLPLLLLHGDQDPIVSVEHSRTFAAALRARGYPVTYREVPGFGHNDDIAEAYQREIADFLAG